MRRRGTVLCFVAVYVSSEGVLAREAGHDVDGMSSARPTLVDVRPTRASWMLRSRAEGHGGPANQGDGFFQTSL